ncbi:hypothetical protein RhiJN_14395 [Ceratobasidium sp. AG-Ba]|nr:hypothetical protein RhiJN_14395 [Ceratobasidium sp. AG-Ba]
MNDYRRMLYRLDLATSFRSVDALLHHFTNETLVDGFIEIRVYSVCPSPDTPAIVCPTPSARLSFFRDPSSGEVLADKLFEPTRNTSVPLGEPLYRQRYIVAQVFPSGTLLAQAFNPIIQPLLKGDRSTLVFEYRAFLPQPRPIPDLLDECEVVSRQAPHKLMVGYIGRSEKGTLSAYQLDDNVARTTFLDMNPMAFHVGTANRDLGRECVIA